MTDQGFSKAELKYLLRIKDSDKPIPSEIINEMVDRELSNRQIPVKPDDGPGYPDINDITSLMVDGYVDSTEKMNKLVDQMLADRQAFDRTMKFAADPIQKPVNDDPSIKYGHNLHSTIFSEDDVQEWLTMREEEYQTIRSLFLTKVKYAQVITELQEWAKKSSLTKDQATKPLHLAAVSTTACVQ